jgi:hypothetical protein
MLSRGKKLAFALVAMTLSAGAVLVVLLGADLLLHARAEKSAGLNRWGYRGPVLGRKQPGETRIVMLGGSTLFGYGVSWQEAIPALLEVELRRRRPDAPISVVNLGFNNEASHAFASTLRDYAYLDYDVVVLYEGYNDLGGDGNPNRSNFRRDSAVFRLTGYLPMLPLYMQEKAMAIRHGGDLAAAYRQPSGPTVFTPNLAQRTSATVLESAAAVGASLGRQLGRFAADDDGHAIVTGALGCQSPWIDYCANIHRAIGIGLESGTRVLVVGQPALRNEHAGRHAGQQAALRAMIERQYAGDARVQYVSVADVVDVNDRQLAYDTMHLTLAGNQLIAGQLVEPVLSIVKAAHGG